MPHDLSRRDFVFTLSGVGALAAGASLPAACLNQSNQPNPHRLPKSPFRIAVINDEISQDFDDACDVAANQFGMSWIEIRAMWKKNIANLDANEIAESQRILKKYDLRVTDIASPLYKTDWPGAAQSKYKEHDQFGANFSYSEQDALLDHCIELAKKFSTERIRCFDFWRLEDQAPHRQAINEVLQKAAERVGKAGLVLVLENEYACNTATGAEAAKTLAGVPSQHFMLNWDPGNAAMRGETPYPDGYKLLPKHRIGHCHCKDYTKNEKGGAWAAVGKGTIDWTGQFSALKRDGYHYAVSLETHWRGAGTPEASSIQSWAGMKEDLKQAGAL